MNLRARLKSRGYRLTPQRELVYKVLGENAGVPMKSEEVLEACRRKDPSASLPTVYRSLQLFSRLGIALPVHIHGDAQYYEINAGQHHHHLVCVGCGTIKPVEACVIDEMEELIRDDHEFLLTSHCLSLFGYCADCLPGKADKRFQDRSRGAARAK